MRTVRAGDGEGICSGVGESTPDCSGEIAGRTDCSAVGALGRGDCCAKAAQTKAMYAIEMKGRDLSIIAPVQVWKDVVTPFAIAQELFIDIIRDKLIV